MEQNKTENHGVRLMSVQEASRQLGVGHWMMYQLIHQKSLKTVKIGKRRLVSSRAIDEFISSMEQ
jgi:excisionase family DNA binding protein